LFSIDYLGILNRAAIRYSNQGKPCKQRSKKSRRQNLKLHVTSITCRRESIEGKIMKEKMRKKAGIAKRADLTDWLLAIDANVR
jgi:hypothetical protein